MKRIKLGKVLAALTAVWLGVGPATKAFADALLEGEKWTDKLKFSGDLRLRHEAFYVKSTGASAANSGHDRSRERMRLRFGVVANIQDVTAGLRLASGVGEQVSTNQTYQNDFNQKGIWIDQAYLSWKALEQLKLTGGKMPNPFWRTYASDVMWDDDINPEGYAQQIELPLTDRANVFLNAGQFVLSEGGTLPNPWMLGNQLGSNVKLTEDTRVTMAGEFYAFVNENNGNFVANGAVQQYGNSRTVTGPNAPGQLATSLQLFQFTGELATHVGPLPLTLDGDYIHNAADTGKRGGNGYQTGVIVGKAKAAKTWEAAYFYKYLQSNASMADIADSDFGYTGGASATSAANAGGGTNRKGHIMWLAYAPRDYVTIKAKYFITEVLNPYLNGFGNPVTIPAFDSINRFQLDVMVKF